MKIQFITGLHGDEHSPILALSSARISHIVANPEAVKRNKRFVEKDMNASFGTKGNTIEEIEARQLLQKLDHKKLIVDFHTTRTTSIPFVIIVDIKMLEFACTLGINNVVYMAYNIKEGHSLINYRNGVSVEVGNPGSKESFETTLQIVENLKEPKQHKVEIYEVYGTIEKPGRYINFTKYANKFYPIFAGKNAYGVYGLKARKIKL